LASIASKHAIVPVQILSSSLTPAALPTLLSSLASSASSSAPVTLGTAQQQKASDFRLGHDPSAPESAYLKMLHQIFGDRLQLGNVGRYKSSWGVVVKGDGEQDRTVEFGLGVLEEKARARADAVASIKKEAESGVCPPALKALLDEWSTTDTDKAVDAGKKIGE
jgi:hypothetical protein